MSEKCRGLARQYLLSTVVSFRNRVTGSVLVSYRGENRFQQDCFCGVLFWLVMLEALNNDAELVGGCIKSIDP